MRVYIYCWDDSVREYSWNTSLFENFMCKYSSLKFYKVGCSEVLLSFNLEKRLQTYASITSDNTKLEEGEDFMYLCHYYSL